MSKKCFFIFIFLNFFILKVGFFPAECVELIDNKTGHLPQNVADNLPKLSQSGKYPFYKKERIFAFLPL